MGKVNLVLLIWVKQFTFRRVPKLFTILEKGELGGKVCPKIFFRTLYQTMSFNWWKSPFEPTHHWNVGLKVVHLQSLLSHRTRSTPNYKQKATNQQAYGSVPCALCRGTYSSSHALSSILALILPYRRAWK